MVPAFWFKSPTASSVRKWRCRAFTLPKAGEYAVGYLFMPQDEAQIAHFKQVITEVVAEEGQTLLGFREVPVDNASLSKAEHIAATEPHHVQVFIGAGRDAATNAEFERRLFTLRKVISNRIYDAFEGAETGFYPVSLSTKTIVYKGMFLAYQVAAYFKDLADPRFESAVALVHQRFSTNTFPSWKLAHPYRMVAHNGEINTLRANVNWMAARQASVSSPLFGGDISKLWPISYEGQSDTACFDNALEFLVQGGYPLSHAVMMLIPEAWAGNQLMAPERKAFYEYHAALMEPWDGPATVCFTDGKQIGATLDRNGLRPARYLVTDDDRVILASEAGTLPVKEESIVKKWRLQPGKMLLIDMEEGRIISDEELKVEPCQPASLPPVAGQHPAHSRRPEAGGAPGAAPRRVAARSPAGVRLHSGRHQDPDVADGHDRPGSDRSMGTDTPISAMSDKTKLLYTYFKQNFAQVTNPPIDPIREELVMSLVSFIGPRPNLLDHAGHGACQAAGSTPADPDQWRSGKDPLDRPHGRPFRHQDARFHL